MYIYILFGGIPTPLKNRNVNWDDDIPYGKKMFHTTNQLNKSSRISMGIRYYTMVYEIRVYWNNLDKNG